MSGSGARVVVIELGELKELIHDAVVVALQEAGQVDCVPSLVDREGLAKALGCSVGTVDRLRDDGMPTLAVGDSPRFQLSVVLTWLAARPRRRGKRRPV